MIYQGVFVGALTAERATVGAAVRRVSLSVAILLVNTLLLLAPPAIALGALLGVLK